MGKSKSYWENEWYMNEWYMNEWYIYEFLFRLCFGCFEGSFTGSLIKFVILQTLRL